MTREELKAHCLRQVKDCEMRAKCKGEEPHGKVYEEHKLILELLEQEPFINKPCISKKVCKHDKNVVLDKIRTEIIMYEGDCRLSVDEYPSCKQCTDNVFETIYGIFDKYTAEIEG